MRPLRLLTDRTGTISGPSRLGEMGSFVVRSFAPGGDPGMQGGDNSRGAIRRAAEKGTGVLWRVLSSRWALIVPGGLLALWFLVVMAVPGFRPGFTGLSESNAGQMIYAWDLLHPASRLALRGLYSLLMMVLLTRLAKGLFPSIDALPSGGTSSASVAATLGDRQAEVVWERMFRAWGRESTSRQGGQASPVTGQALLYPVPWRRMCSQLPVAGAILALAGVLVLWLGARGVTGPPLLGGDSVNLPGLRSARTVRIKAEELFLREQDGSVVVQLSWTLPAGENSSRLVLGEGHWRPYRGHWLRVVDTPPALSLSVRDAAHKPLPLVPVIGDRQSLETFRGVVPEEELVLTVPEAGIVVRVVRSSSGSGEQISVVEALDGGLGTLLGSAVPAPEAMLELPGATVVARSEPAAVVSIWRLPGVEILILGALVGLAGLLLRRRFPPWRAWIGIHALAGSDAWQVLVATEPPTLATSLCERLSREPGATAHHDQE